MRAVTAGNQVALPSWNLYENRRWNIAHLIMQTNCKRRKDAMYLIETERSEVADRVVAVGSCVQDLVQQIASVDFSIKIDGESLALLRTSHTVTIRGDAGEEAVVRTKEEFWNAYDLFERSAEATGGNRRVDENQIARSSLLGLSAVAALIH